MQEAWIFFSLVWVLFRDIVYFWQEKKRNSDFYATLGLFSLITFCTFYYFFNVYQLVLRGVEIFFNGPFKNPLLFLVSLIPPAVDLYTDYFLRRRKSASLTLKSKVVYNFIKGMLMFFVSEGLLFFLGLSLVVLGILGIK